MTITREKMIEDLTAAEKTVANRILHEANRLQDEYFKAAKKAEEVKGLRKISRFLATMFELTALLAQTPPGQGLYIDADNGNVYRGRVKVDKMTLLPEKLPGRQNHAVDTIGRELSMNTEWAATAGSKFQNSWARAMKPHLYREEYVEPIYGLFQDALAEALEAHPDGSTIRAEIYSDPNGLSYYEVFIEGLNFSVAAIESGKFVFYRHKGGEPVWC